MAAPGEVFPQSFALGILQLANQQKMQAAQLREQRSTAAARNFLEKERLRLQEMGLNLEAAKAGLAPGGGGGSSGAGAFRAASAQSALGARDQLALAQGQAAITKRQQELETFETNYPGLFFDQFENKGVAFVADHRRGELLPALRERLSGAEDEQGVGFKEIPTKGGSIVVRIGGRTAAEQKDFKELQQIEQLTAKYKAETGLAAAREESAQALTVKRTIEAREAALTLGGDISPTDRHRALLQVAETAERTKKAKIDTLSQLRTDLFSQRALAGDRAGRAAELDAQIKDLTDQINKLSDQPATAWLAETNPALSYLLQLPTAQTAAAIGATDEQRARAAGQPPPRPVSGASEQRRRISDDLLRALHTGPADLVQDLATNPEQDDVTEANAYQFLPTNLSIQQGRSTATFHVDQFDGGVIPTNEAAYKMIAGGAVRDVLREAELAKQGIKTQVRSRINTSARWRMLGWTPEKAQAAAAPREPASAARPAPAPEPATPPTPSERTRQISERLGAFERALTDPKLAPADRQRLIEEYKQFRAELQQ